MAELTAAALREWAAEARARGAMVEARELERLADAQPLIEILPRGTLVSCGCPRAVDFRPRAGDESITVWHRPECPRAVEEASHGVR
jgi:hypothetical protein